MSDTLQEREDQMTIGEINKRWCDECEGVIHAPWCSSYIECKSEFEHTLRQTLAHLVPTCSEQSTTNEHQPAARGGGEEWRVSKPLTNQILRNDIGGSYRIAGIDVITSDHDHLGKIVVFGDDCDEVVAQIVAEHESMTRGKCWCSIQDGKPHERTDYCDDATEHNAHHSLVAERERLRSKLEEIRSTLGGLRNHLRPTFDDRAEDYIRFMFEQIETALSEQRSTPQ